MPPRRLHIVFVALLAVLLGSSAAAAQSLPQEPAGIVELQATAQVEVVPDLAVITLAVERSGADAALLTAQVGQLLDGALRQARTVPDVMASSSGFTTQPHWKTLNGQPQRDGWTVRAGLRLESHDMATLGKLSGQLARQGMMIESAGFEVSRAQREREETALIGTAISRFESKAATAARALGYSGFTLRSMQIEPLQTPTPQPRPLLLRAEAASSDDTPAVPLAAGRALLQLTVRGAVLLTR
jgi:predicted secreted protein